MPKKQKTSEVPLKVNFARAGRILTLLNGWRGLHFTDTLVSIRASRLRQRLEGEMKPVREELSREFERIREQHGVFDKGTGQKELEMGSEGGAVWERESERVMVAGEIEITERFNLAELVAQQREQEPPYRVSEYKIALSPDEIEALGVGEILIIE